MNVSTAWTDADQGDLLSRAQYTMTVVGRETVWVRAVFGTSPERARVVISLDQLTLRGPLPALRERLSTMLELLDDVAATPQHWPDIEMERVGERRWQRRTPHPYVRKPATERRDEPTDPAPPGPPDINAQ